MFKDSEWPGVNEPIKNCEKGHFASRRKRGGSQGKHFYAHPKDYNCSEYRPVNRTFEATGYCQEGEKKVANIKTHPPAIVSLITG